MKEIENNFRELRYKYIGNNSGFYIVRNFKLFK